jgi:hypothetical protein
MSALQKNSRVITQAECSAWTRCGGLTKVQAEQLLDWLEANGCRQHQLSLDEHGFVIRYQRPQGFSMAPVEMPISISLRKTVTQRRLAPRPTFGRPGRRRSSTRSTKRFRRRLS